MATTRTVMTPEGDVVHFDTVDQTAMTPSGAVVNATIEAAAGGYVPQPRNTDGGMNQMLGGMQ